MKLQMTSGVRRGLLIVLIIGGTRLLALSARSPTTAPPLSGQAAAQQVRAVVGAIDTTPSTDAVSIPAEFKWKGHELGAGAHPAIATSAAGELHVVFREGPNAIHLKHAWRAGNKWHSETIFSAPDPSHLGDLVALAIGSDGVLHVAFTTWDSTISMSGALYYGKHDDAGWHVETVEADAIGSMSIAVDDAAVPHILHLAGSPAGDVRYLTRGPRGWSGETISSSNYSNWGSALQLHDSKPYAVFMNGGGLQLAIGEPGGWTVEVIAGGTYCTFAFDGAGALHVAYVVWSGSGYALIHASLTEGVWTSETLVDETMLFGEAAPPDVTIEPDAPALAADASGRIRLAFGLDVYKGAKYGRALMVAFLDDGAWLPVVAGTGRTGFENSITADAAGLVHVAAVRILPGDPSKQFVREVSLRGSKLTLAVAPKGSGTIGVAALDIEAAGKTSVSVFPGDTVTLTATAADGFAFAGWSGAVSGMDPVVDLTMDHAAKASAHFVPTGP